MSWGIGCAQLEYPGVYVKLAYYISYVQYSTVHELSNTQLCRWILKKTGKSTYCDG